MEQRILHDDDLEHSDVRVGHGFNQHLLVDDANYMD